MANKVTIVVEAYQLRFVHESSSKGGALSNVSAATAEGILISFFADSFQALRMNKFSLLHHHIKISVS